MRENPNHVLACPRMGNGDQGHLLDEALVAQILVDLCQPKGGKFAATIERVCSQDKFPGSCMSAIMRSNATKYSECHSDGQAFHDRKEVEGWQVSGLEAAESTSVNSRKQRGIRISADASPGSTEYRAHRKNQSRCLVHIRVFTDTAINLGTIS